MSNEKPSWDEKPKFKEFDYFGRIWENLGPTKQNYKDRGIISLLPTLLVVSSFIFMVLKWKDSSDWPSRPGDRWYKSLSEEIANRDEEYRRTHHLWPDWVMIPNGSQSKAEIIKPVEHTNTNQRTSTKEQRNNKPTLKRIKRIGQ